jgi:hypothetical protein
MLSMTTATLRLLEKSGTKVLADPTPEVSTVATKQPEPSSSTIAVTEITTGPRASASLATAAVADVSHLGPPTTAAATEAPDLASPAAAALRARTAVRRLVKVPARNIRRPVNVKRLGSENLVNGFRGPRYQAEVEVKVPHGSDASIPRKYFVTLQYVGDGEWLIEDVEFARASP